MPEMNVRYTEIRSGGTKGMASTYFADARIKTASLPNIIMPTQNSEMIAQGLEQKVRLERLNNIAKKKYNILQDSKGIKKIEALEKNTNVKALQ